MAAGNRHDRPAEAPGLQALPALIARRDWPAAERLLRRAARRAEAPAAVFYNLAKVLEAQGKTEQRLAWLARATAADPAHADAWFETGRARLDAGDLAGAEAAFARAAALQPQARDAWAMLLRLRLRLARWREAREALARAGDLGGEGKIAAFRIACELGEPAAAERAAMLADPGLRPAALRALAQTARGRLPLRLPAVPSPQPSDGAAPGTGRT
jgi:tetratricopeptide (TPR) repeat protein